MFPIIIFRIFPTTATEDLQEGGAQRQDLPIMCNRRWSGCMHLISIAMPSYPFSSFFVSACVVYFKPLRIYLKFLLRIVHLQTRFLFLDALQFFLLPLVLGKSFFALIISNTMYAAAFSWYFYISHLGYRALPFLTNTEVFLFPIVPVLVLYVLNFIGHPFGLGLNASRLMAHLYFD